MRFRGLILFSFVLEIWYKMKKLSFSGPFHQRKAVKRAKFMIEKEASHARKIEESLGKNLIDTLTEALGDKLWGVVLFGSRARGKGKSYSDWDIFILADGIPENPVDRNMFLHDLFFTKRITGMSPILRTREEFEKNLRPLYLDIAWDGIVLFDRNGYVKRKVEEIRRIIDESGLQRNKKRGDWAWEWENPPEPGKWEIEWHR